MRDALWHRSPEPPPNGHFEVGGRVDALIKQGKAVGDVAQNAKAMGEKSVEIALQVIKDKGAAASIPKVIDSGFILVHPWNVDAYSKANFGQ